ncbi:MAG TPA: PH domain-containing protein [Thermoplasmata archaeon]|nr:PH domain-containing protein [Thermoplasmata archaeon]
MAAPATPPASVPRGATAATSGARPMPRLLKATYLADQEFLLEETRATKLYYFPGPILVILVFGLLALFTGAYVHGWSGQISAYNTVLSNLNKVNGNLANYLFYFWLLLVLVGLLMLLVRYLRWIRTVYAVTSHRVIVQKGILGKDFHEIPVTQVRGVDVRQGFFQRILGYGTVRVSSEGGSSLGNEDWKGIPKPFRFQKMIEDASQGVMQSAGAGNWVRS